MPPHLIICALIALSVALAWLAGEFYVFRAECRRLQRTAPPRLPFGAPSLDERTTALEEWRRSLAERAAKEQVHACSAATVSKEEQISHCRAQLLASKAIVETLHGHVHSDMHVLLNVANAKATIASCTERLRYLGSEA